MFRQSDSALARGGSTRRRWAKVDKCKSGVSRPSCASKKALFVCVIDQAKQSKPKRRKRKGKQHFRSLASLPLSTGSWGRRRQSELHTAVCLCVQVHVCI